MKAKAPSCLYCSKKLKLSPKYIRERGRALTADGNPPMYGYEGNNMMCSSRCGMLVAIALLKDLGGVQSKAREAVEMLLPAGWNKRSRRSV